ncbi:hypothetical protein CcaverHIS002_0302980 [Cutaneotrichosporon cavernicola]|uniref:Uncharacterized protein n=1 Tax=Cutaneotrichosporon cavernicola TaxID=279322 RepID=A0AA48IIX0_9TREE|nr:uncharacterized protein CcaverHIS019_0302980 [Cutaneotrichosporon cavernicola]BEI82430.1 hypothetical protein CcaverHIS002_0302980 [Cutaneotrichosporon cavernicola]BEI90228.1 hypothetical protein CcaverHIS019_0302980 [Cutaneotrichosporon cavernicola]BEI98007.1 hypothetical protein CcaverHIS631_0303060 [Cutaneotrichosporon cavernicola]BEJ05783.1 hypothetical protein CcaverHIS641_0303050 [Cutaneotrichosporon cavernicola]
MKLAALALLAVVAAAPAPLQHPIFRVADGCAAHCVIPKAKDAGKLRDIICSREGRRRMLECATCLDAAPEERVEAAMDEYRRVMAACEAELFNE